MVDTVGLNPLVRRLMVNGAGAICGMVEAEAPAAREEKPSIALTEFGFCDKGAHYVRELLEKDFNIISFHATGIGEKAAVDLVGQKLFEAFIDLVPSFDYAVAPDAQSFVLFQGLGSSNKVDHIIMVTNWFADLEQTFARKAE